MQVSREELLHIANLAHLKLEDEEVDTYLLHLQDILNFAEKVNNAPTEGLSETIGANDKYNVFRKDEITLFGDRDILLQNAPEQEQGMFKIPKVIQ
jgi:aspartyl-tRNA(Asn)/glutamyl-tRNA(Gln) amidotransferase subunit C